jgi:hypothetical protein
MVCFGEIASATAGGAAQIRNFRACEGRSRGVVLVDTRGRYRHSRSSRVGSFRRTHRRGRSPLRRPLGAASHVEADLAPSLVVSSCYRDGDDARRLVVFGSGQVSSHLPRRLGRDEAWGLVEPPDWPGLLQPPTTARVVWVPVNAETGQADGVDWLPSLSLNPAALTAGEPRAETGALLPTSLPEPVYIPVWEFARGVQYIRVLDCAAQVLPCAWPLRRSVAALRLAFWGWMGIVGLFLVGLMLKMWLLSFSVQWLSARGTPLAVQVLGVVVGLVVFGAAYVLQRRALQEPARTAMQPQLALPFTSTLRPIPVLVGLSMGYAGLWSIYNVFSGALAAQSGSFHKVVVLQGLLSIAAACLCWRCGLAPADKDARPAAGWGEETARSLSFISSAALAGGLFCFANSAPEGLLEHQPEAKQFLESAYQTGCTWGATFGALLCAGYYGRAMPILVSLLVNATASALWGDTYALFLTMPVLLLTLSLEARGKKDHAPLSALTLTWRATVAGLVGKIAGRCFGFLFLGEEGFVVMEMVLERLFFIVALVNRR